MDNQQLQHTDLSDIKMKHNQQEIFRTEEKPQGSRQLFPKNKNSQQFKYTSYQIGCVSQKEILLQIQQDIQDQNEEQIASEENKSNQFLSQEDFQDFEIQTQESQRKNSYPSLESSQEKSLGQITQTTSINESSFNYLKKKSDKTVDQ